MEPLKRFMLHHLLTYLLSDAHSNSDLGRQLGMAQGKSELEICFLAFYLQKQVSSNTAIYIYFNYWYLNILSKLVSEKVHTWKQPRFDYRYEVYSYVHRRMAFKWKVGLLVNSFFRIAENVVENGQCNPSNDMLPHPSST